MEENEEINMLPTPAVLPEKRRWNVSRILGTLGFIAVICLVLGFSWRVFGFYREIRDGTINPALAYTTTDFTRAATAFAAKASQNANSASLVGVNTPSLGEKKAKITVVEFADFGCPYSQEVASIVRAIAQKYPTDVRVVFRNFPIEEIHPGSTIAAQAGGCAAEQGKFWEYHDAVLASNEPLGVDMLSSIAENIALDIKQFARCIDSNYYANGVESDIADGVAAGVTGTPTFFFNGQKVEGSIPFTVFTQILDAMLQT